MDYKNNIVVQKNITRHFMERKTRDYAAYLTNAGNFIIA
jgi:hypothetical protein